MIKLEPNEKIINYVYRHWFILLIESLILVLIGLLPLALGIFASQTPEWKIQTETFWLGISLYLIWLLFVWLLFWLAWTDHYLDVWVITSERIIDIEQKGLFRREISSLQFNRIQDVTIEINGFLATLLNFGDIMVQTAGQNVQIIFKNIAEPYKIKDQINQKLQK